MLSEVLKEIQRGAIAEGAAAGQLLGEEFARLKQRNARLEAQNTELQSRLTKLENDNRKLRKADAAANEVVVAIAHACREKGATITEQVAEFHRAFGFPVRTEVPPYIKADIELRIRLIVEEAWEVFDALGYEVEVDNEGVKLTQVRPTYHIPSVAKELADLDYVVEGTRLTFGIPRQPVADEVHRSNMSKVGGVKRPDGKLEKPATYSPADVERAIREAK